MGRKNLMMGFTLVELMVTMAIIGVLALIALPAFDSYIPGYRVGQALKGVATEMNLARMKAIANNEPYYVGFDPVEQRIGVAPDDGAGNPNWAEAKIVYLDTTTAGVTKSWPGVKLGYNTVTNNMHGNPITQVADFGGASLAVCLPNGMLASGGQIYLIPSGDIGKRNDRVKAVEVRRTGEVLLHRFNEVLTQWEEL